ncbi:MAG: ATP-binding protein [Planctomycetota bacterium]|nr:ATP-binding protein [Planctomycetota bacterium]
MFKSIRWKLQLWHALLLLLVMCIFGSTLYVRLRHARFLGIDAELRGDGELLAARLRPGAPPRPWHDNGPETRASPPQGNPQDGPPRRRDGGRRGPPGEFDAAFADEFERRFEVPDSLLLRFEGEFAVWRSEEQSRPYFAIWRSNGQLLRTSKPALQIPSPDTRTPNSPAPSPQYRQRGDLREVIVPGPFAMQVLVGRSIRKEQSELRQLTGMLGVTGAAVTFVGLLGGWLLSKRAVRPIQAITSTARSISGSNLSGRISVTETESELGSLASVLNAMFARLEAAFERQVRFTADASHELRTPLSIIYSHAELALGKQRSPDEYRDAIETCFRASKRMKSLVDSLLVLARADAGKLEIKHEQFDLGQAVEDCVGLVSPLAAEKNIQLKLDLQPVTLSGDPFRIAQVISNLLTNAINYNREHGSVTVGLKSEGAYAMLSVADTGVGIPEDGQKHLFERFYRVDKARSREQGGTGLGLAICRSIIEAHGGAITFTSRLNEGTTFIVRLPQRPGTEREAQKRDC